MLLPPRPTLLPAVSASIVDVVTGLHLHCYCCWSYSSQQGVERVAVAVVRLEAVCGGCLFGVFSGVFALV